MNKDEKVELLGCPECGHYDSADKNGCVDNGASGNTYCNCKNVWHATRPVLANTDVREAVERAKDLVAYLEAHAEFPSREYISALEAVRFLANLAAVSRPDGWVRVEDRLPEDRAAYLVTCDWKVKTPERKPFVTKLYYIGNGSWADSRNDGTKWYSEWSFVVTAWTSLPAPYVAEEVEGCP